jgi:hypothetical protein
LYKVLQLYLRFFIRARRYAHASTSVDGDKFVKPISYFEYLAKAKQLVSEGKSEELVDAQCWLDKTPISAQTYPSICKKGSSADIYGKHEGKTLLSKVNVPMLIVYVDDGWGIKEIDGDINHWLERTNKIKNPSTAITIVDGAGHSFRGKERDLADQIDNFLTTS